jgi:hypothetical protein
MGDHDGNEQPRGWQPADLRRLVARGFDQTAVAVVGDAVANQLSSFTVATIAPRTLTEGATA